MPEPRAFVIGHPISHSRSPLIHRHWLAMYGLAGAYDPVDVAPPDLGRFLAGMAAAGFAGGNVTLPHKESAFAAASRHAGDAVAVGAVNTLWLEDGRLVGDNTDVFGFLANLDERAPGWDSRETAMVLGAGGAARAIVHALRQRGFSILIANRTRARAEDLAGRHATNVAAVDWAERDRALSDAGLLVNTTALGLEGHGADTLPVDLARLADDALVTDIVYTPLITPFLAAARARGLAIVDGLGMLLHQARPGFARWFGVEPEVTPRLRALVEADIGAKS
ncbi:MAG: shikimate dehydrogenase [Rhizobiaceae bacterium]